MSFSYSKARTMFAIINPAATYPVTLERNSSIPLLLLPNNASLPPAILPDSPALFPDCRSITVISPIPNKTWNTSTIVLAKISPPFRQPFREP